MEKLSAKKTNGNALSVAARKSKKFAPASRLSLRESWHLQAND